MSEAMEHVLKGRRRLVMGHRFFAALTLQLPLVEDLTCQSFWTDGVQIGFNPEYALEQTIHVIETLLAHEGAGHVGFKHHLRQGTREHKLWNIATDHVINLMLQANGFKLWEGALADHRFTGMSAEKVYAILADEQQQSQDDQSSDDGSSDDSSDDQSDQQPGDGDGDGDQPGEVRPFPGKNGKKATQQEIADAEADLTLKIAQAVKAAQVAGDMPAGIEEIIKDLQTATVNWKDRLVDLLQAKAKDDYSWARPDRRFLYRGLYMPTLHSDTIDTMVFAIDTSISMNTTTLELVGGTVKDALQQIKPSRVIVIYCDTEIHRVDEYEEYDDFEFTAVGRGGTSCIPPFEYVYEQGITPCVMMYFTDLGYGEDVPDADPGYPVIWVTEEDDEGPFGDTVRIES